MSQEQMPSWLPRMLEGLGELRANVQSISARMDRADRQRERMEDTLTALQATISQQLSRGQNSTGGSTNTSMGSERMTWEELLAHVILRGVSLPWRKIGGWMIVGAALIEHALAPTGWLADLLKWVAALRGS
jgi:hypothetical protein